MRGANRGELRVPPPPTNPSLEPGPTGGGTRKGRKSEFQQSSAVRSAAIQAASMIAAWVARPAVNGSLSLGGFGG